jgi:hypothetical protein
MLMASKIDPRGGKIVVIIRCSWKSKMIVTLQREESVELLKVCFNFLMRVRSMIPTFDSSGFLWFSVYDEKPLA